MFWSVSLNIAKRNDDDVAQNKEQHTQKERTRINRTLKCNISKSNRTITDCPFLSTKLYYHNKKATGGMIVKMSQTHNYFSSHERRYLGQIQFDNSLLLSFPYEPRSPSRTTIAL
jgi:hypothetical protein